MADFSNTSELGEDAAEANLVYLSTDRSPTVSGRHWKIKMQSGLPMRVPNEGEASFVYNSSRSRQLAAKRFLDVVISAAALMVLLPLFVLVSISIKLTSPGPVLFRQSREGLEGRPFLAIKFRSMRNDLCDISGVQQTLKGDPRVTPVGRFIRRTSIDELPQLINVLRGEMSLVGPRPHVKGMLAGGELYRDLVPYYDARLAVVPGLTGWAQANGLRGPTSQADLARSRIDHDIAYIQNFSVLLDIKILFLTVWREFVVGNGH